MKKFDQINMIPFIDIMLVLLAIVLTTASFVSKGLIQIDIPIADQASKIQDTQQRIQIALNAEGVLFFNELKIPFTELNAQLETLKKTTDIELRIDQKAEFQSFIEIINTLKSHQLENFSIETQFPQS